MEICKTCGGENYVFNHCCSGLREMCGCMGHPVSFYNCPECNPNGDKPEGPWIAEYSSYIEYTGVRNERQ
jgi:hypothetical protein